MNVTQPSAVTSAAMMAQQSRQVQSPQPLPTGGPEQDTASRVEVGGKAPVTDASGSYGVAAAKAASALSLGGGSATTVWEKTDEAEESKDSSQKIQEMGKQVAAQEGFASAKGAMAGQTAARGSVDILA